VRRLAVGFALLALGGCGGNEQRPYFASEPPIDPGCLPAGREGSLSFRACYHSSPASGPPPPSERHGSLEVSKNAGPWRRLAVPHPLGAKPGEPAAGHWEWAAVSPDGKWLLAQWTAECEVPIAFFVPADGGDAIPVGHDRYGPATSKALGWTRDGRGIVELPGLSCGSTIRRPGTYVLRPHGKPQYWQPVDRLTRSTAARDGP
jgi:hypothetical protein